ncbi:MAG: hypothetical protein ACK6D4_11470, partial [Planctomyces sp.]
PSHARQLRTSAFCPQQAARFAARLKARHLSSAAFWLQAAFHCLLQRAAADSELQLLNDLLQQLQTQDRLSALQSRKAVCLALLNLNEFLYLD